MRARHGRPVLNERAERWLPYADRVLFDLAADFEQYPSYLPGWHSAWIERREGERLQAEQTVGFGPVRLRFRTTATLRPPQCIEVVSDDPQFNRFNLTWTFSADGMRGCCVGLSVELELRAHLLQHTIEAIGPGSADSVLGAFAQRAHELFGPVPDQRVT